LALFGCGDFYYISRMADKQPSPLQAAFRLTRQERVYLFAVCALVFIGLAARWFYLKTGESGVYTPAGMERTERPNE